MRIKRAASLLLLLVMVFCLTACGGNSTGQEPPAANPPTKTEPSENPPTETEPSAALPNDEQAGEPAPLSVKEMIDSANVENAEAYGVCGPDLTWYYRDGVFVIKGTGTMTSITAPMWKQADFLQDITTVLVAEGVTAIAPSAFGGSDEEPAAKNLSRVELPSTLERIYPCAFAGCTALTSVTVPDSVTMIADDAFDENMELNVAAVTPTAIPAGDSTQEYLNKISEETAQASGVCGDNLNWYYQGNVLVIKGTGAMANYFPPNYSPWHKAAASDGLDVQWVIIEEGVTTIGGSAFRAVVIDGIGMRLSRVELPSTLESICDNAFYFCSALRSIDIPDGVTFIGDNAFRRTAIKELTIPASVTKLGYSCAGYYSNGGYSVIFEGDAPEMVLEDPLPACGLWEAYYPTVYYSGSGFEPYIEKNPEYTWIQQ